MTPHTLTAEQRLAIAAAHFADLLLALRRAHAALVSHPGGDCRSESDILHCSSTLALATLADRTLAERTELPAPVPTPEALPLDPATLPAFLRRQA